MKTYHSDAIIADGKQLLQTIHTLFDKQCKISAIVNERILGITLIPEESLWLHRATNMGLGDRSYFYVRKQGEELSKECFYHNNSIWPYVIIPKTNPLQTIWRIYLLDKADTQLPAFWHGAYGQAKLIFESNDMDSTRPIDRMHDRHLVLLEMTKVFANRDWSVIAPIEELQPRVTAIDDRTYQVICCYWNDWEGLVRETATYVVEDTTITAKDSIQEVLYPYHCGIMF